MMRTKRAKPSASDWRSRRKRHLPPVRKRSRQTPLKIRSQLETRIASIEREIVKLDARKLEIERLFTLTETYDDRKRVAELETERTLVAAQNAEHLATWERLHAQLEELAR